MKKISVVIPVYNNENTITILYNKLIRTFKDIKKNYEILFVDDGSKDNSFKIIKNICSKDKKTVCIKLTRNFGQRFAIMAGLKYSTGDYIVNLDADLQDPPNLIKEIYKELKKNYHIVIAARKSSSESFVRRVTSSLQHNVLNFLISNYPKEGFTVFGISRKLANQIKERGNNISLLQLEILNYGYNYKKIYYKRDSRVHGVSQFSFSSRLNLAIEMITLTNSSILRFSLYLGTAIMLICFLYIFQIFYNYFHTGTPFEGYSPIIVVTLFLGGLNIFILGILSEYISVLLRENRSYDKFKVGTFLNISNKSKL